eukprot:1417600-Amphidinium_carterae.1
MDWTRLSSTSLPFLKADLRTDVGRALCLELVAVLAVLFVFVSIPKFAAFDPVVVDLISTMIAVLRGRGVPFVFECKPAN